VTLYETNERLGSIVLHDIRLPESPASYAENVTALFLTRTIFRVRWLARTRIFGRRPSGWRPGLAEDPEFPAGGRTPKQAAQDNQTFWVRDILRSIKHGEFS
jgi:hypothetical protein